MRAIICGKPEMRIGEIVALPNLRDRHHKRDAQAASGAGGRRTRCGGGPIGVLAEIGSGRVNGSRSVTLARLVSQTVTH